MRELGVFCGTFNPIHLGHLLIAECARDQFALEKVIFITSPRPPHRSADLLAGESRHLLVSAAVAENPGFESSSLELEREGPSYTADTVQQLLDEYARKSDGQWRINLILGADNLPYLNTWNRADYLKKTCRFLVAPRLVDVSQEVPGPEIEDTHSAAKADNSVLATVSQVDLLQNLSLPDATIETIHFPCVSISSSAIRVRLSEGRTVLYMVPPAVNELLLSRNFYGPKHK